MTDDMTYLVKVPTDLNVFFHGNSKIQGGRDRSVFGDLQILALQRSHSVSVMCTRS